MSTPNTSAPVSSNTAATGTAASDTSPTGSGAQAASQPAVSGAPQQQQAAPKQDAAAAQAPKEVATAAEVRRLKLKLDGADIELPESEVIKLAQMSGSAQKRFMEAAAEKKKVGDVLEFLKANPKEALKRLGIDLRKFSEDTLTEIIKQEQESPEAKKARELEEKLRAYELKDKEAQEAEEKRRIDAEKAKMADERQQKIQHEIDQYTRIFTAALEKADVPKTAASVARMAQLQKLANIKGYKMDPDSLAKIVSEDYQKELQAQLSGYKTADGKLDGDKIMAYLGDTINEATTKAKIAKLKGSKQQKFADPSATPTSPATSAQKPGSWREFTRRSRMSKT